MPELPEVETTRRGVEPHVQGRQIREVIVRNRQLRWPVPRGLTAKLRGQPITQIRRRGKYLVLDTPVGSLILHLGMSGSLRVSRGDEPPGPYDHVDIHCDGGIRLRLRDPRRFGSVHWTRRDPLQHALLRSLGPEPMEQSLAGHLYTTSRGRRVAVKQFLMNSHVVAGIGNIYASEILYRAGIHPQRAAGRIARDRYEQLARACREVMREAIRQGGTTLRDFVSGEGRPGYFSQALRVYGRGGESCQQCGGTIRQIVQGQRSTFYCPGCQR
jgi:formamidopyrimidine-DNA glycosylase